MTFLFANVLLAGVAEAQSPAVCAIAPGETEETHSQSFRCSRANDVEFQKIPPIEVFDNLFYVGPGYVSVWLLATTEGLILFDGAEEPYVEHILDNIRSVGFDPGEIRHIFITHGHLDHFGGVAQIQELSGARVGAVEPDWELIEQAATRPGRNGGPPPRVPTRDMVVQDGELLTMGGETITLYHTPGHTPGVLSAEFTVYDNGRPHKAFLWGGPGERQGLEGAQEALATAERIAEMSGIEVGLMVHSWLARTYVYPNGNIFERAQLLAGRAAGDPHPFVDPASWAQFVAQTQATVVGAIEEAQRNTSR